MCSPRQLIFRVGGFISLLLVIVLSSVFISTMAGSKVSADPLPEGRACTSTEMTYNQTLDQCEIIVPVTSNCPTGTTGTPLGNNTNQQVCRGATIAATAADDTADTCIIAKDSKLRWIACPLTESGAALTGILDKIIYSYMTIDSTKVFGADANPNSVSSTAFHNVWGTFRAIGLGLLIIAGLFMIISEALGFDFVDAYTIRKTLPRLLIAAIGIAISWPLLYFLVNLFNDLGGAVGSIIDSSFSSIKTGSTIGSGAQWFIAGGAIAGAFVVLQFAGILSLLGTAILGLIIGILILILRESIIVLAVIISPLAIAAYVLPNTAKFTKFWWDTFIRALMMFPIIVAFIALGRAMSAVTGNTGTTGAAITSFILYFLPYFMLPFTLRLAGGLVATIGGLVNDRSRGGFDRLKNFRANKASYNVGRMKSGERFNGRNALSRGFNNASFRAGVKNFGLGAQGKAAYTEKASLLAAAHAKSDAGQAAMYNDHLLRAQTYASESAARENMGRDFGMDEAAVKNAITAAKANGGFGKARQVYATKQLAATGTGYDDVGQMASTIARVAGGNGKQGAAAGINAAAANDLVGAMRGAAKASGRIDLGGAGHGSTVSLANEAYRAGGSASQTSIRKTLVEAARSTDNTTIVRGKPTSTAQLTSALTEELRQHSNRTLTGTPDEIRIAQVDAGRMAAKLQNIQDAAPYGHELGMERYHQEVESGLDNIDAAADVNSSGYSTQRHRGGVDPHHLDGDEH